jgi:hypothetical protein
VRVFFRLRSFNIVGFLLFIFTALHVSVLGPSSCTHIYSIVNRANPMESYCLVSVGRPL